MTEAGIVLDLLDTLSHQLTSMEVGSQRRLVEHKYRLLSTTVDPRDKEQVHDLASQALNTGNYYNTILQYNTTFVKRHVAVASEALANRTVKKHRRRRTNVL